jgi:hypothetical protein
MPYTPPSGDDVDFVFQGGYVPPAGDNVDFLFGIVAFITIESISRNIIYDDELHTGFYTSVVRWQSSASGSYRMEVGGDGVSSGDLVKEGNTFGDFVVRTDITDSDIEDASTTFSGAGSYRFNIYVLSADNIWTPYNQS